MSVLESTFSGWGRFPRIEGRAKRPEKIATLQEIVRAGESTSLTARGAGRSYGDAALNKDGYLILTERLNRMLAFNKETGVLCCEAGVTLGEILDVFVPHGWFLPVIPGTRFVTVGGAVAFDIHGKNHHCDGSFANFVTSFQLLTASGDIHTCSPHEHSDVFWATLGGAGLTGIITQVSFRLRRIASSYIKRHTIKAKDLDEALALFDTSSSTYPYAVAWIDCLASGRSLGRSILMFGQHARLADLDARRQQAPLRFEHKHRMRIPFDLPASLLNPRTVKAFNMVYYARQRSKKKHTISPIDPFFFPLDAIKDWNRMYGKRGFVQYQCVFPVTQSREALIRMLTVLRRTGSGSFLAVFKRLGPASEGLLSFPMSGHTLSLDIPVKSGLAAFLDELSRLVVDYGGRVYLAKDAYLKPDVFRAMYPAFPKWAAIKARIDPHNIFASALSRRLRLEPSA